MLKKFKKVLSLTVPALLIYACGGDTENLEQEPIDVDTNQVEVVQEVNNDYYQIPSPDEMFSFIKESGLEYNGELLNSIDNVNSYNDPFQQTKNFGVYSADLAYTAAYEEYQESIKYFGSVQKLGDQIGIASAFDKQMVERIQNNLDNADSLVAITNDSYFSVVEHLEANEQADKLGVIAACGWLETVYIVVNTTNYNENKAAVERLADQKHTLDNIIAYLEQQKDNDDVASLLDQFSDLEVEFDNLSEKDSGSGISLKKKESGKMVLGGGSSISITEEQFNTIKEKVNIIRKSIVETNA